MKTILQTFILILITSPIFAQTISYDDNFETSVTTLNLGAQVNGKNSYSGTTPGGVAVAVEWSSTNNQWEITLTCGLCSGLTFINSSNTPSSPPDLTLGTWTNLPNDGTVLETFSGSGTTNVLPVELVDFYVISQQYSIGLKWVTAWEETNEGFEVQRSIDGQNYEVIDFVDGYGNSLITQEYVYEDKTVEKGIEYYYRLRQLDYNGNFGFSPVITARIDTDEAKVGNFYPNPTNGITNVNYTSNTNEELVVSVFNITGQQVLQETRNVTEGLNNLNFNFGKLEKGTYFIRLQIGEDDIQYQKVVIQ